jgi:AP-1-like transcription factor
MRENTTLKETIASLQRERDALQTAQQDRKRHREDSPSALTPDRKKSKGNQSSELTSAESVPLTRLSISIEPSSPSMVSTPDTLDTTDSALSPIHHDSQVDHSLSSIMEYHQKVDFSAAPFPSFSCGFCSVDVPCVCREVGLHQASGESKIEVFEPSPNIISLDPPQEVSILDNLPAYQPPIPLRRKTNPGPTKPVFEVTPLACNDDGKPANCSGDPSNCAACADDTFGRAFCEAIGKSASTSSSYTDTDRVVQAQSTGAALEETISTDAAWKQLKSHPNVEFSDLSLLADVVARRSKCTGPRVLLSPPPTELQKAARETGFSKCGSDSQPVLLTDPHAPYHSPQLGRASPPLRLVPQEILVKAGQRRRIQHVNAAGVQDALRLLDAKFA